MPKRPKLWFDPFYNTTGDVMYDSYVYCYNTPITLTFSGLPTGIYDIILYGHGAANDQSGIFTLNGTTKPTAQGPYWNNNQLAGGGFIENTHYVLFRAVPVSAGIPLVITAGVSPGQYTVVNGVQIAAVGGNAPPVPSAGANQTIIYPAAASLQGSATDDSLPAGSVLSLSWSAVSGPGTVTFNPATGTGGYLYSTAGFSAPGTYVLRLTASDGALSGTSDVAITVNASGSYTTWDLKTDWSDSANPNGVWAYRRGTTPLSLMNGFPQGHGDAFSGQPAWMDYSVYWYVPAWFKVTSPNVPFSTYSWQTGDVVLHSASSAPQANVVWTAPSAGTINIAGNIWMVYSALGRYQQWKLYKNSTILTSGNLLLTQNRGNPCNVAAGLNNIPVAANDTIQLEIAPVDGQIGHYVGVNLTLTAGVSGNTPPAISPVANQTTLINTPVGPVGFAVGDAETPAASLTVSASSANVAVVPNANIALGGAGNQRTVTVTPATGQTGSAAITLTVSDGSLSTSTAFTVTVIGAGAGTTWDLKTDWSDSANPNGVWAYRRGTTPLALMEGFPQGHGDAFSGQPAWMDYSVYWYVPAWFKVKPANVPFSTYSWQTGDVVLHSASSAPQANVVWTAPSAGTVNIAGHIWMVYADLGRYQQWKLYKNSTILTSGNLLLTQNRANPCNVAAGLNNIPVAANDTIQLEIAPVAGQIGHYVGVNLTLTAVFAGNTAPTISEIPNQTTPMSYPVGPIGFTVGDAQTPVASLGVSAISLNPILVPNDEAHLTQGGSGANRTLTVTPATGQTGSATIQVTVSDGAATATNKFNLTVNPAGGGMTWDLKTDWSDTVNPNGVWAYRRGTTPLTLMNGFPQGHGDAFSGQPAWMDYSVYWYVPAWFKVTSPNVPFSTYSWQTGDVVLHSASSAPQANVVWTAPSAGTVNIAGSIWMVYSDLGRYQQWKLYKNSTILTSGNLPLTQNRGNPCNVATGLNNLPVAANDTIQLEIAPVDGQIGHYVGVNLHLTANTPPANPDADHDGLPDAVDAYPAIPDTTAPSFTITAPVEGANLP